MSGNPASMIAGIGAFAPDKVLSNFDLEKMVDTTDEWIRERTGIERRHILESNLTNSDMAAAAARRALEAASMKPEELDCIITATISPDSPFPSTACRVQAKIGAEQAAAMDVATSIWPIRMHTATVLMGTGSQSW